MKKGRIKFSASINEKAQNELKQKVQDVLGSKPLNANHEVSYYQDIKSKISPSSIVFFDEAPVPKEVDLTSYQRMVFSSEPSHLAHEIALSQLCEDEQEINSDFFFTSQIILKKKFELKAVTDLKEIETFFESSLSDRPTINYMMTTALSELVKNSFTQITTSGPDNTLVMVEVIRTVSGQWGVKVKDFVGTLEYSSFRKNFSVYKDEKLEVNRESKGAGFGLGLVMSLAHRLYVIVKKDVSTEILFIFDPSLKLKRSFQYFEI